jgi:hypothetical protein
MARKTSSEVSDTSISGMITPSITIYHWSRATTVFRCTGPSMFSQIRHQTGFAVPLPLGWFLSLVKMLVAASHPIWIIYESYILYFLVLRRLYSSQLASWYPWIRKTLRTMPLFVPTEFYEKICYPMAETNRLWLDGRNQSQKSLKIAPMTIGYREESNPSHQWYDIQV